MSYEKKEIVGVCGDMVIVTADAQEVSLEVWDGHEVCFSVLTPAQAVRVAHRLRRAAQSADLEAAQVEQLRLIIEEA